MTLLTTVHRSLLGLTGTSALLVAASVSVPAQAAEPANGPASGGIAAAKVTNDSPVGSGWQVFYFGYGPSQPTFTFETQTATRVTITDAFCKGDAFTVYDSGTALRTTPTVPAPGCLADDTSDPDVALRDPAYSHSSFILKPGTHAINIAATVNPYGSGGAYIRFDFPPRPLT